MTMTELPIGFAAAIPHAAIPAPDAGPAPAGRATDDLRIAMMADLCPAGSGPCGCGSGPPRICGAPGRPDAVRKAECLDCRARDWWESGVEAGW